MSTKPSSIPKTFYNLHLRCVLMSERLSEGASARVILGHARLPIILVITLRAYGPSHNLIWRYRHATLYRGHSDLMHRLCHESFPHQPIHASLEQATALAETAIIAYNQFLSEALVA